MIPSPKFNKDIAFSGALNAEPPNDLTFSISSDALLILCRKRGCDFSSIFCEISLL